ncbi:adenylate/guanylate cyclase domain-containing protein [Archangium violaceum]|uniref:adenylate/guanylate cyclase domain-containing protein n=1 Tax=Archangium violaceum TaxID=83451 RepID=UPI00193AED3B|nr:adenylate/guanylate cyclase domain-containing protein [Archangium violaceum]QRK07075.1 adenylate/guanylate cyclase domain-containing protein [Archangium violaceum]
MKTANLAIVFTDIKGFTERTSRQTLEENQRLLKVHHDLLAPVFKAFGGRIIKSIGDAFLVTFESPTQAVLSGMAIQDRLWSYNRGASDAERLDVRVAINVGEVRLESNDVFGEPVNIASRVESIAEAGEVFFTEAVYLAMNKAEVPSLEVGAFELKGIPGKIRVFRVPRAPYRVETPSVVHVSSGAGAPLENEQPPFGNLALSRVPSLQLTPGTDLAATAAAVGGQIVARTRTAILAVKTHQRLSPTSRKVAVGGGALVLLLLGVGFVVLRDSPAEAAIKEVAKATSTSEKLKLAERARNLISVEKDSPGKRAWLLGRLDEALDAPNRAVELYRSAVKAGNDDAGDRLAELLKHPECRVRANAADALGDLKRVSARGALEDLAEEGGPGEESGGLFQLGCNSRKAAQKALERLGR